MLDVGGWMKPFPRADYVMDIMPCESRGLLGQVLASTERFDASRWLVRDFCDREPYPFPDKYFDYVTCSHVLEDVRDPIWICSELERIAKAGYIETPSRLIEQTMGVESLAYPGYCHHRWLVETKEDHLWFSMKNARIAASWRHHFPKAARRRFQPLDEICFLFWNEKFSYSERILITIQEIEADLERIVRDFGYYPEARYRLWNQGSRSKGALKRMLYG